MIGFDFNKVSQWVGNKTKLASKWVGNQASGVVKTVKNIIEFPAKVLEAVKLYTKLTTNAIIKNGKPILDSLSYTAGFMSDRAYDWFGSKRRADTINVKGKEYTKLYDDQHGVAYDDEKYIYSISWYRTGF